MIKQFNISKLSNFNTYKNVRVLAGKAGSGKSTEMYKKALKYCKRGFTVYYIDVERSVYGKMFHTYVNKIDNDLFSYKNLPDNLKLLVDIHTLDDLQQILVNIDNPEEKTLLVLDFPMVLFSGVGYDSLIREVKNLVGLLNVLKLKTFMTMQTSRTGTLSMLGDN